MCVGLRNWCWFSVALIEIAEAPIELAVVGVSRNDEVVLVMAQSLMVRKSGLEKAMVNYHRHS